MTLPGTGQLNTQVLDRFKIIDLYSAMSTRGSDLPTRNDDPDLEARPPTSVIEEGISEKVLITAKGTNQPNSEFPDATSLKRQFL